MYKNDLDENGDAGDSYEAIPENFMKIGNLTINARTPKAILVGTLSDIFPLDKSYGVTEVWLPISQIYSKDTDVKGVVTLVISNWIATRSGLDAYVDYPDYAESDDSDDNHD